MSQFNLRFPTKGIYLTHEFPTEEPKEPGAHYYCGNKEVTVDHIREHNKWSIQTYNRVSVGMTMPFPHVATTICSADRDRLHTLKYNPIWCMPGFGAVIWGQQTTFGAYLTPIMIADLAVREIVPYCKKKFGNHEANELAVKLDHIAHYCNACRLGEFYATLVSDKVFCSVKATPISSFTFSIDIPNGDVNDLDVLNTFYDYNRKERYVDSLMDEVIPIDPIPTNKLVLVPSTMYDNKPKKNTVMTFKAGY